MSREDGYSLVKSAWDDALRCTQVEQSFANALSGRWKPACRTYRPEFFRFTPLRPTGPTGSILATC